MSGKSKYFLDFLGSISHRLQAYVMSQILKFTPRAASGIKFVVKGKPAKISRYCNEVIAYLQ